jgi:hypothetical protein
VQQLLLTGADRDKLAAAGVGWVVVENAAPRLRLPVAYHDDDLTVYWVGGDDHPRASGRGVMLAVHWVWFAVLALGGLLTLGLGLGLQARPRR